MKKTICMLIIAAHLSACATYETKSVSFKPPQAYGNYQDVSGLQLGAEAFADKKRADAAFGFDIQKAGVLPVQIVLDNKSGQSVEVVSGQTFLVDKDGGYWKILTNHQAVGRVQKATEGGAVAAGAGKGAAFGALAGAVLGLAVGIVSGRNAGEAVIKGGVLGGAGGAVIGGAGKAGDNREQEYSIADAMQEKGVEGKIIPSESLASGFIFFPVEATSASELRLQILFRETGSVQTLHLKFP